MSWLLVVIAAQFINGSSAIIDKLLLKKSYPNPIGYTFWLGILGLFSVIFIPFGFQLLPPAELLLALLTGGIFVVAMLFYFLALFRGEASNAVILIGALSPIFTLTFSSLILDTKLSGGQIAGFAILIIGGIILFFVEQKGLRFKIAAFALASAFCFGLSNTLTKRVFEFSNFATGFVWIKAGGILLVLAFLLLPALRRKIIYSKAKDEFRNKWLYLLNRGYAGSGSVLIYYAILLGIPPLVDATYNLKYFFIFLGGWLILKERFRGWVLAGKIAAVTIIVFGILWLAVDEYLKTTAPSETRPISWGVTFSQKFAEQLSLDWKENYEAILNDLEAKNLRLIAYWDFIEPMDDDFNFSDLDYQMKRADETGADTILIIGQKVPRWPECHIPNWVKQQAIRDKKQELLEYLENLVNRYKNNPALKYWQVENEPFLAFGECTGTEKEFLDEEVALVKKLDSAHPILITDSGELGLWYSAAKRGDVFGTTMYRRVYHWLFGYVDYHLPPAFFRLKEKIIRLLTDDYQKRYIVSELAAEPWLDRQLYETMPKEQLEFFDLEFFKDTIEYAKGAGFDEYYLWGAEWWYWLKENHNRSEFWDFAKTIIR